VKRRLPAVAGTFYPGDSAALEAQIDGFLRDARRAARDEAPEAPALKAIIAPHAGTVYSGPIAASAYVRLTPGPIRRVVLLGPAHRVWLRGLAAPSVDAFATPLGDVPLDRVTIERLLDMPQVHLDDEPHRREHSLEVHLPFLQRALGRLELVPLVVGEASAEEVAEVLDAAWGGSETLVVVSSDLSHYHDYATARALDRETTQLIEGLAGSKLTGEHACGYQPVRGLLRCAERRGLHVRNVDLRNSGDTAGGRDEVVGYGSYVVS
jgi:hypothetical protein